MKRLFAVLLALVLLPATVQTAFAQGYRIQAGDVLRVEVLEDSSLNRDALVLPDGNISLPLAGRVRASGLTLDQVEETITRQLQPGFATPPTVFVTLTRIQEREAIEAARTITIHVIGEAGSPGPLQIERGANVLQAFAAMGGFSRFAAVKRVQLRRVDASGREQVYRIDYDAIERGATGAGSITLADGDVIVIPQRRLFE